jgi:hypothetical protein
LTHLKDSLTQEYRAARSEIKKQTILEKYQLQLEEYLDSNDIDSIKVEMDEVIKNGTTITTKSHVGRIQFLYGLTFKFAGKMSPKIDSIYTFMQGLKKGNDTVVNFAYTGRFKINSPDSTYLPIVVIYAFPVPLQYTGK